MMAREPTNAAVTVSIGHIAAARLMRGLTSLNPFHQLNQTPMASISQLLAPKNQQNHELDYYENAEGWKPTATVTLVDLIAAIRSGEFSEKVEEVREILATITDDMSEEERKDIKRKADEVKKTLPAISVSGCLTKGRRKGAADEGRFAHSGLLQIDLDAKDNPGWSVERMVSALHECPHIQAGYITPSGAGVKGLARVPADATNHKRAFFAAEAYFAALGLKIDRSCKDPVRLCFVSSDSDAWIQAAPAVEFEPIADDEAEMEISERESMPERARACSVILAVPSFGSGEDARVSYRISERGGIIIQGGNDFQGTNLTAEVVREMLKCIPPRPAYDEWLKIASAVWDVLGESEGNAALASWSPEEKPGEYAEKFPKRLKDVHGATLVMKAKENAWAPKPPVSATKATIGEKLGSKKAGLIPEHVFPVPAGDIGHDIASRHIFAVIGPHKKLFMRGTTVHEVAHEATGAYSLSPVDAERFASLIETFGARVMRLENREDGAKRWRSTTFPVSSAKVALKSDAARETLPTIRQLVSAPVLVGDDNGGTTVISKGWHPHGGGTFVTSGHMPPEIPLDEAVAMIFEMLTDFDFAAGGDGSRAIASILSPAMKIGGWIDDDFPLDIAEADQSQSGKTYRHKLICAIYREAPSTITQSTGGVGSLDERVAAALIAGRPFISLDNLRGRMDSQTMESAIRGQGRVTARALRHSAEIDCSPFLWQLSTNGAELTRDLANRAIITRIRKRTADHQFQTFPEGDLLAHVRANQPRYLAAVHAIIREWVAQGRQRTDESRHDFRLWCRTMDWIVRNIFGAEPLLDGHREEQLRTANPKLQWLRDIINAVLKDGYNGAGLTASDLAEVSEEHDVPLPGRRGQSTEALEASVGKVLGRLFKEADLPFIIVDGRKFTRIIEDEYNPISRTHRDRRIYVIENALL